MIKGTVINGEGIGRKLGWPTANLDVSVESTHLQPGVYAAKAYMHGTEYGAALVISKSPEYAKVEVHLIEYSGDDFYGEELSVEAVQKVSEIEIKESEESLQKKIGGDMQLIKDVLYE